MLPEYLRIACAVALPFAGGLAGSLISRKNIPNWYENLNLPKYRPPNWVFGPVWTALYAGMGYASYLVWRDGGGFRGAARLPLMFYGAQLALNWVWTPIFFGQHNLKWGFIDLAACAATAAAAGIQFYGINRTAGYIFIPYLAWLSFAGAISYSIWRLNPEQKSIRATAAKKSEQKQI